MATLIRAAAEVAVHSYGCGPGFRLVIGGDGRQAGELEALATDLGAPVSLTGRLSDRAVADLYRSADLMAMVCNERWFGLEQEGFGIAFLEAAAAGLPQIAGRSGGSHEAVVHGVTGLVVDDPTDVAAVASALDRLIGDGDERSRLGAAARRRASRRRW